MSLFPKKDATSTFQHDLAALIAMARRRGVDRQLIRQSLKEADEGLKDVFAGKAPYVPPPSGPKPKKGLAAKILGLT